MAKCFLFCVWVLAVLVQSSTVLSDIIHLDFENFRKGVPTDSPPVTSEALVTDSPKNHSSVYCTNNSFPTDIFCNVNSLGRKNLFGVQPVTYAFYLKYGHPSRQDVDCFVYFENDGETFESRLNYTEFLCYNPQNVGNSSNEQWMLNIKWDIKNGNIPVVPEVKLPVLSVGDLKTLEIYDRSVENLSFKCRARFDRLNSTDGGKEENGHLVIFDGNFKTCISSAPPIHRLPPQEVEVHSEDVLMDHNDG